MNIRNLNDNSDDIALGPVGPMVVQKSADGVYNSPGMPAPPAGWGRVVGFTDPVDNDDEGPESKDEY
jgi:hypothetical protein